MRLFSFVVPIYRELHNGNVPRLLDHLNRLSLHECRLQVVLIVNNSVGVARDIDSPILKENLETIDWIQRQIESQTYSFAVEIVDLATEGIDRNMGRIRQIGVEHSEAMAASMGVSRDSHILVHFDSDTLVSENLLSCYQELYSAYADLSVIYSPRKYELRNRPSLALIQTHPWYRVKRAYRDLKNILSRHDLGFATYQISSRASAHFAVGGFRPLPEDEDGALSEDFTQLNCILNPNTTVWTEDRTRSDGFTAAKRITSAHEQKESKVKTGFPFRLLLINHSYTLLAKVRDSAMSYETAVSEFIHFASSVTALSLQIEDVQLYEQFAAQNPCSLSPSHQLSGYEWAQDMNPISALFCRQLYKSQKNAGEIVYGVLRSHLSTVEQSCLDALFEKEQLAHDSLVRARLEAFASSEPSGAHMPDPFVAWAIGEHPEFTAWQAEALTRDPTQNSVELLVREFPEWLAPMQSTAYTREFAYFEACSRFLLEAQVYPERLPLGYKFLVLVSRKPN